MEPLRNGVNVPTTGGRLTSTSSTTPPLAAPVRRHLGAATTSNGVSDGPGVHTPGAARMHTRGPSTITPPVGDTAHRRSGSRATSSYGATDDSVRAPGVGTHRPYPSSTLGGSKTFVPVTNNRSNNVFVPGRVPHRLDHAGSASTRGGSSTTSHSGAPRAAPIVVTINELMTYPLDGQCRVIDITAMVPISRRTREVDAEGFESFKTVTTYEETPMTVCADNVRYAACKALRLPTDGLCTTPRNCHCAHFNGRMYGNLNLCGQRIAQGSCTCGNTYIHIKETPTISATASAPMSAGSVSAPRGAYRRPVAAPVPVRKMMCWPHLAGEMGISGGPCNCKTCFYAHTLEQQVVPEHVLEWVRRLEAGTLITQTVVDEVPKVLMTNETYRADVLELCGGSWPPLIRSALSQWFVLWFRAVNKFRNDEDPSALALFGEANGLEEKLVWETVRRFQSCTASFAMAEKRVFGTSTLRIIPPTGKKHDGQVVICQGGKSCNHGAHYPVCLGADGKPDPTKNETLGQIDLDNFNGIDSFPTHVDREDILRQNYEKEIEFARADAKAKEKCIAVTTRMEREASRRSIGEQMEALRAKYLNSYSRLQVIPTGTVLVVRAPVIKAAETPVTSVDLTDTTVFTKLPELTEAERRANAEQAERARVVAAAKAEERRKLKAVADAALAEKETMERENREINRALLVSAIGEYATTPTDTGLLWCLFREHAFATVQVSGDTRSHNYNTHTMEGKQIIYEVTDTEGNVRMMMRAPRALDLVPAYTHINSVFVQATKDMTVEIAQEFITSGAIDHISFWVYIKNSLVREAWAQFKATGSVGSWTEFYARVTSKHEEWDNIGIIRHVVRASRNRRGGKSKRSKYDEDDGPDDEVTEYVDTDCAIKKQYTNFWAYFNKLPKTAIGAGFVMSTWASELATAETALFEEYLSRKLVSKFDNWIQDDPERAAIKAVYDAHKCTWTQAQVFSKVISVRAPEIDFDDFVAHYYDAIAYCFSPASRNTTRATGGGVSWEVFKTNPDELLQYYSEQSSLDQTFEAWKKEKADGWTKAGKKGDANLRTVMNSFAGIPFSEIKAVAKAMEKASGIIAKLDSMEKMIAYIHENGQHPLGQKFIVLIKGKSYEIATSLWDGVIYKLLVELSSVEPKADVIRALRSQLPASDATATAQRDAASDLLATLQQAALKKNTADICGVKGKRRVRDEMEARLNKERAELEASLETKKALVLQTATNIWISDAESGFTPVMELVQKVCNGETITLTKESVKATKVPSKKSVETAAPVNMFAPLKETVDEVAPFDAESDLKAHFKATKPVKTHYIKVDHVAIKGRNLGYRAIMIGPFETKNAATPLFSLLRTRLQGGACISKLSAKLFEVHIYLTRPDGKKANENCTRLELNDDNCMTELIADIAKAMTIKPSAFKTGFELPKDEDVDDSASTASTESDIFEDDDSASTASTDSDDSDDSADEIVLPGTEVNRSFGKTGLMPGDLELDGFDTIVSAKPGARGNGKTIRRETISDERKDRGMRKKGACGAKNTRGDNVYRDTRGDDDRRRGGRDDDE